MKKYFLLFGLLFTYYAMVAQSNEKLKEKAPTQKDMQVMMSEMQKLLDDMSEEDKKEMGEMGIKMPDLEGIQKIVSGVST